MVNNIDDKLVLAISSRALFDLRESHKVYLSSGVEAYRQYQIEHEDEVLAPGTPSLSCRNCWTSTNTWDVPGSR